jgi:hypothetical protein
MLYESAEAIFYSHLALCEETYQFLLEENRILKQTGQPPDGEFLNQKQSFLLRFDVSNRALFDSSRIEVRQHRPVIEKAQRILLKTLLLDRENEQLLLKSALRKPATNPSTYDAHLGLVSKLYLQSENTRSFAADFQRPISDAG